MPAERLALAGGRVLRRAALATAGLAASSVVFFVASLALRPLTPRAETVCLVGIAVAVAILIVAFRLARRTEGYLFADDRGVTLYMPWLFRTPVRVARADVAEVVVGEPAASRDRGVARLVPGSSRGAVTVVLAEPARSPRARPFAGWLPPVRGLRPPRRRGRWTGFAVAVEDPAHAAAAFAAWEAPQARPAATGTARTASPAGARRWPLLVSLALLGASVASVAADRIPPNPACAASRALLTSTSLEPVPPVTEERRPHDLARLLPPEAAKGTHLDLVRAAQGRIEGPERGRAALERYGFLRGFRGNTGGSTAAAVLEFNAPGNALAFQAYSAGVVCERAAAVFAVPGVPGALGVRWVSGGFVIDQVTFVRGSRRYGASVFVRGALPDDHSLVIDMAVRTARTAG